jgi:AAA15 family ATPase/GTPase
LFGDTGFGLGRVPHIGIESDALKHPLSQFGDGMNRLFDILIALANVPGGILILDEVENGLHYSILTDVWKTIFNLAKQLNVQVFATTHSWECIVAFQIAAEGDMQDEVLLIRLRDKNGRVVATDFDAEDLDVITRGLIEVR